MGDQHFADAQSPPQFKRQRTHSMSEGFHEAFGRPSYTAQDRGNGLPFEVQGQPVLTDQELPLNGNRRTSFGEMALVGSLITGSNEGTLKAYASCCDDGEFRLTLDRYYNIIHPTLPVLPHNDSALNRLTNCPPKLRESFFLALEGCIRSFAPKSLPQIEMTPNQLLQQCFAAVDTAKYYLSDTDSSRQFYNHLVYCKTLVLLAAACDRPGSGGVGSTSQLLGQIAGCFADAGMNDSRVLNVLREQDLESFYAARRVFWTAFILDRFHASARSKDLMLPLHSGSLSRDDYVALGDVGYHLARKFFSDSSLLFDADLV
jgi:hypothetical protein